MEATTICPTVPVTETKTLLNMYRIKGTQVEDISEDSCRKLSKVGFITKNRGG